MKKLWSTYSYSILLLVVSCISALFLGLKSDVSDEEYIKVTVSSGDTIWNLAYQYADDSDLSEKQFVNWVMKHNELSANDLYPGEKIILPVKNQTYDTKTELASAIGE